MTCTKPPAFERQGWNVPVAVELHRGRNGVTIAGLYFFGVRVAYWVLR